MSGYLKHALLLLAIFIGLSACTKLTSENYEQLKMGMTQEEVEQIIGEADRCASTLGTVDCWWGNEDDRYINVKFIGGNAVMFSHQKLK